MTLHPIYTFILAVLSMLHAHQAAHRAAPAPQRASRGVERTHVAAAPCGGWRHLVERYEWNVDWACRVLVCESRGRSDARNGKYVGLMQVGGGSIDPERNIAQAHQMWLRRGTQPWECK